MADQTSTSAPTFRGWMGSMWLYTTLRFGLFGVLWGLLYLLGLSGFLSATLGLVLSVPLSFVLLARPRARFTQQLEQRVKARQVENKQLAAELDPDAAAPLDTSGDAPVELKPVELNKRDAD